MSGFESAAGWVTTPPTVTNPRLVVELAYGQRRWAFLIVIDGSSCAAVYSRYETISLY
jgi:hypothetical protein